MTRRYPDPPQLFVPDPANNIVAWQDYHARFSPAEQRNFRSATWDPESSLRPHYSARLVETVYWCMHPQVGGRPSTRELLRECEAACKVIDDETPATGPRPRDVVVTPDKYPYARLVLNDQYR
ncbi:uncharacterized protein K452DRAFT_289453 [Aplosporella prunicola CBS 121167]|uniref:Uncharacterized protein n=1 Tax=Aplosporella prunicola CBS 121167 TaxID=1176127 RepID=A0A6A6B9M5_9PEZI|nr:uncharacterized protein K452DRAFT_289453 [Aplosporella prunicola CBS 121167]KAF2140063.1 hypothetical protein K452DRAFT_289453 [Aplosporella prunicola CBS 121167]